MPARVLLVSAVLGLALTGCGSDGSGEAVAVKAGDTTCEVATTEFEAGEIEFAVENVGKDTTEVYVYGKGSGGEFDKVIGEVENIAPGTSRDFEVEVGGGDYEVACKPGQKGDGIRTKIEVEGDADSGEAAYDREKEFTAESFAFKGLEGFTANAGEKIEFKMKNNSTTDEHEFELFGPDGKELGEIEPVKPGEEGEVVIELEQAGTYTYKCGIDGHEGKGMTGTFTVS